MKDPTSELHEAYFQLLNGNISVSGTSIPVFKWERPGGEMRIEVGKTTLEDSSTNTTYIFEILQDVTIVGTLRMSDERQITDDISNEVVQLVTATTPIVMESFYSVGTASLISSETFEDETYDNTLYKKELTFKHIITQN